MLRYLCIKTTKIKFILESFLIQIFYFNNLKEFMWLWDIFMRLLSNKGISIPPDENENQQVELTLEQHRKNIEILLKDIPEDEWNEVPAPTNWWKDS